MRIVRSLLSAVLVGTALLSMTGCDPATGLAFPDQSSMNYAMANASYRAADHMIKVSEGKLPTSVPLLMGTVTDINKIETSSPLGRMIAEQVGARFVQRGYTVSDVRFRNAINVKQERGDKSAAGEYFLSRDTNVLKGEQDVGAVVTGTYSVAAEVIYVNLRMIEASNSHVLASVDYRIPMTNDIKAMVANDGNFFKPGPYARDWDF